MVNCNLKDCNFVEMEATTDKEGMILYTCPQCGNEVSIPVHKKPIKKRWFRRPR